MAGFISIREDKYKKLVEDLAKYKQESKYLRQQALRYKIKSQQLRHTLDTILKDENLWTY